MENKNIFDKISLLTLKYESYQKEEKGMKVVQEPLDVFIN